MPYKRLNGIVLAALCISALFLTRAFVSTTNAGSACPSSSDSNGDTVTCKDDSSGSDINTGSGNDKVTFDNSYEDDIHTNDGNDSISLNDSTADEIHASDGTDSISFNNGSSANEVHGGDGQDTLTFNNDSGAGSIDGGHQDDKITFNNGSGADYVDGGHGEDTITFTNDSGANQIDGGKGADSITFDNSSGAYSVDGGTGDDTIIADGQVEYIEGGDGDDIVAVGDGNYMSQLDGGDDYDVLQFTFTVKSKKDKEAFDALINSMDASSGYISFGGHTYEWINFEFLQNLLRIAAAQGDTDVVVSVIGDNRLNQQDMAAPVAVYCNAGAVEAWTIGVDGQGSLALSTHVSALPQTSNGVSISVSGDQVVTTYGAYSYSFTANLCPG